MNRSGFSLPIIWISLIIIGVLTYFFGWFVLVLVLLAAGLITLGTYIHDKIDFVHFENNGKGN